jgi:hypothetical protein
MSSKEDAVIIVPCIVQVEGIGWAEQRRTADWESGMGGKRGCLDWVITPEEQSKTFGTQELPQCDHHALNSSQ